MDCSLTYKPGQLWTCPASPESRILILKCEKLGADNAVHVSVLRGDQFDPIHMPFNQRAIDASVGELLKESVCLPDFESGYKIWRKAYQCGESGLYRITVSDALAL